MAGTAVGIFQAQQSAQMQARQAQQNIDLQARQRNEQAQLANKRAVTQYAGQVRAQQAGTKSFYQQLDNINSSANKTYVQEQAKLAENRQKAAFKTQEILRKSIGIQGKILASGATGQSVGLLALDAERQAGFAQAQQNASVDSAALQSAVSQDIAFDQAKSAANQAFNRTPPPSQAPILDPYGMAGLEIPTYA
jgi:ribosomal protein S18|tara:strand:+ start:455 stop:1036 length:582 start_codon:yes stop_codon:yes gene_type:complete